MQYEEMEDLAMNGSADDVKVLLSVYGDGEFSGGEENGKACIDHITESVLASDTDRARKQSLIFDYTNDRGVFAKEQGISSDVVKEFRDTIADLTQQIRELKEGMATRDVVKEMRGAIQSTAKRAQAPGN